ncbi:MAG: hypothetical protein Q9220_006647 [cf. Caloplaca sp. 1 TL-2023]
MSYYFCIVNTRDQPTFELEFGTSKQGGDGVPRFSPEARKLNPFIMHASLDYVDDLQCASGGGGGIANNPTTPQTEEAVRLFFAEVFENWIKSVMSPFGGPQVGVGSPVFRQRVVAAGRKYL